MIKNTFKALIITSLIIAVGVYAPVYGATKKSTAKVKTGDTCCPTVSKTSKTAPKLQVKKNDKASKPAVAKSLPKLLELGSTTCIPCKMMAPILEELTKEYKGKLNVEFVDVGKNEDVARKYKINVIPTQIFFDSKGKEVDRHVGFFPKADILKTFKDNGIKLTANAKGTNP